VLRSKCTGSGRAGYRKKKVLSLVSPPSPFPHLPKSGAFGVNEIKLKIKYLLSYFLAQYSERYPVNSCCGCLETEHPNKY